MIYQLKVSQTAFREIDNAYVYYEAQSLGLGERFLKSIEETYLKLSKNPQFYSFINADNNIREVKIKSFPFVIIFQVIENKVLVVRVFNTNRN